MYDVQHRALISRISVSRNRSLLNVTEQKNSKFVQDGLVMGELDLEVDLADKVNKNDNLVLPGAGFKSSNNLEAKLEQMSLKSTGCLRLSHNNRFLVVLTNEGVLLFDAQKSFYYEKARISLFDITVDEKFLLSKTIFYFEANYEIEFVVLNFEIMKSQI